MTVDEILIKNEEINEKMRQINAKYDLEKMAPGSSYLKYKNMQWGCTKKI